MSRLVLKLGPGERVLINGAVVENGDRRTRVTVMTANANILRLRDAIHPEDATTPVKRVCYAVQLVLSGDAVPNEARPKILGALDQLSQVFLDRDCSEFLETAKDAILGDQYYQALRSLRGLLPREEKLFEMRPG